MRILSIILFVISGLSLLMVFFGGILGTAMTGNPAKPRKRSETVGVMPWGLF